VISNKLTVKSDFFIFHCEHQSARSVIFFIKNGLEVCDIGLIKFLTKTPPKTFCIAIGIK
jgi:hypothetical protein